RREATAIGWRGGEHDAVEQDERRRPATWSKRLLGAPPRPPVALATPDVDERQWLATHRREAPPADWRRGERLWLAGSGGGGSLLFSERQRAFLRGEGDAAGGSNSIY